MILPSYVLTLYPIFYFFNLNFNKIKKQSKKQSFETVVNAKELLGLELNSIKGGGAPAVRCNTGEIGDDNSLSCKTGKWF